MSKLHYSVNLNMKKDMLTICDLLDANDIKLYDCPKKIKPCKS